MISLIYTSTATRRMKRRDLVELLQVSRERNRRLEITGLLLYAGGCFMQALEGAEPDVRRVMKDIEADQRHRNVQTLEVTPLQRRVFRDWSMAFLDASIPTPNLPGYSRFLETSTTDDEIIRPQPRSRQLLLHFKSVMEASHTKLRGLLQAVVREKIMSTPRKSRGRGRCRPPGDG